MNERHLNIVENAFKLFIHYGVSKTSMSEISAAAKVARQTIYKAFDSKEDLIFAALLHYSGQTRKDIERHCASATNIADRLDVLFEHMGKIPFQAMQAFPHMDEVLEIGDSLDSERRAQIKANYMAAIELVLAPWKNEFSERDIEFGPLCEFIKSMFTQIKREARDEEQLSSLFAPLKGMIIQSVS